MLVVAEEKGTAIRARRKERAPRRYADRDELLLQKPLGVFNGTLVARERLLGNDFTVADLNLAATRQWPRAQHGQSLTAAPIRRHRIFEEALFRTGRTSRPR